MDQSLLSAGLVELAGSITRRHARKHRMGISDISVFGLKTRAERILFVIDINRRMARQKGGLVTV